MSDDLPPIDGDDVNETPTRHRRPRPDEATTTTATRAPDAARRRAGRLGQHDRVEPIDLNTEMQRSYIEYAMSVIVSRALPDVRDGLKPVHRRIVYAMYDGGYRPDRGYNKCARVVGDVMGHYHPHGDSAIYDALVRLVQDWSLRYPLVDGQGNFGSPRQRRRGRAAIHRVPDGPARRWRWSATSRGHRRLPSQLRRQDAMSPPCCRAASPTCSSTAPPASRSAWPPRSRRTTCARSPPGRSTTSTTRTPPARSCSRRCWAIIKGPDFPTGALIMGHKGIEDAYRTGRGSIIMRAVVEVEEIQNRQCLVVTELPYQVNPDMLALKIADLVKDGKISGIADIRDETSGRTGQRLVIVLKRDAVAKVVLNNLYKHTQLQTTSAPTCSPSSTRCRARCRSTASSGTGSTTRSRSSSGARTSACARPRPTSTSCAGCSRRSTRSTRSSPSSARRAPSRSPATGLIELLEIDEIQAKAILNMQLRRLAALEREKIIEDHDELQSHDRRVHATSSPRP